MKNASEGDMTMNDEIADDEDFEEAINGSVVQEEEEEKGLDEDGLPVAPFDPKKAFIRCYKLKQTFLK